MAKKQKDKKQIVRSNLFLDMLKRIYLGGIFEECVLNIKKGKGEVTAVDITNSMIVISKKRIMPKNIINEFGLGNLELLIKFLSSIEDNKMQFQTTENSLILMRPDGKRKLNYLLTQTELIATRFQEEDEEEAPYNKISKMMKHRINITNSFAKDFLVYIGLLKTKEIMLEYDGHENVLFTCGSSEDHQFELQLESKVEDGDTKGFTIKLNGEHLSKILSVINFDEEQLPVLSFAKNKPIMIEEGGTAWVLVPIIGIEEEIE